jgi:5-(carboxyamino)imidazole ribonucleotide mutase
MTASDKRPRAGIIMGSDSDWPVMQKAAEILAYFGVGFEKKVVSAHRTPDLMAEYGRTARERGLEVIIAGAGGAAHLPGMTASYTTLPVIGVPVETRHLKGMDSLLSIVQMPRGIPVATVAINNATNAGLLAVQILSINDPGLAEKLDRYRRQMHDESTGKTANLN